MTRRDRCHLTGLRAARLTPAQCSTAWQHLALALEAMGDQDLPKFNQLLRAIRGATIAGRQSNQNPIGV